MSEQRSKDPLHGVTLEMVVTRLFERYGWEELARRVRVKCFSRDPSVKSSLTFFRKTPWARKEVEDLYVQTFHGGRSPSLPGPKSRTGDAAALRSKVKSRSRPTTLANTHAIVRKGASGVKKQEGSRER